MESTLTEMSDVDRQRQAKALGDPTRHRIFRLVLESRAPLTVSDLTNELGFNHNAIRQHLAQLRDAELVVEEREPRLTPGRPRLIYRVHPDALGVWGANGPYEHLAEMLVEVTRTGAAPRDVGREFGRRQVEGFGSAADGDAALDAITYEATMRGFRPHAETDGENVNLVLQNCPFAAAAARDPQTVCDLHLGLAEGMAVTLGRVRVNGLVAFDPRQAGCRLQMSITNVPVEIKPRISTKRRR
jgi:predicted ArsR family transcriptional regulator